MPPKKAAAASTPIPVNPKALAGKSVIITGDIEGQTRASAQKILEDAGAKFEKSLNKKVQLVVLGADAGPKKLEKIEELGIETIDWDKLIDDIKVESGESAAAGNDEDEEMEDGEEAEKKSKPSKGKEKAKANTKSKAEPAAAKAKASASTSGFSISGKTVIVTGTVPGHDRKSATAILENNSATVAKSLNKTVELVILGTNPGPDKMSKIEDLGIETIPWNDMASKLGLDITPEKKVADVEAGSAPNSIEGKTVLITGTVEGYTRSAAQELLENAGATFAKSLNKSVELVVLGTNPGPDKLNKIADLGIDTCAFDDLVQELGLEPEGPPPKKKAKKV